MCLIFYSRKLSMKLQEAITNRRSIKDYQPDCKLTEAEVELLLKNAVLAPTSYNIQHFRFVRVTDTTSRQLIREAGFDQAQLTEASELFIIAADIDAWRKEPERYWANADQDTASMMVGMLNDFYQEREWIQRDEAMRTGALAAQNLMLTAKSLGYDTCPMGGFDRDRVAEIINLPDDHVLVMMITVGKAIKEPWPRGGQLTLQELVFENSFS